jgi:hypothetical protein
MAVKRSTVSFDPVIWKRLSQSKNKSKVVNDALLLFFQLEQLKAEHECEFSEKGLALIHKEIEHYEKTGESYSYEEVFSKFL